MTVTPTYIPLATITLSSAQSSVTFGSISQSYRDLVLVCNSRSLYTANNVDDFVVEFNGDTGSNYSTVFMAGYSGGAVSETATNARVGYLQTSSSGNTSLGTQIAQINDYAQTDKQKTFLGRASSTDRATATAARWANTAAITSIKVFGIRGSSFAINSTFNLYGIH
jgi:hypothetical protein